MAGHPEFADRRTAKVVDGREITGWFTEDFTLDELKTLRAKERIPLLRPGNALYDGRYEIPTLQEIIDLAQRWHVGVYPETKSPRYFDAIGLSLELPLAETLRRNGWAHAGAPVFLQSFDAASLMKLACLVEVPLIQPRSVDRL